MDAEDFKQMREEQKERRAKRLPIRTAEINELKNEGYTVLQLTDYQFRVNGEYDLYPIHNRWHHLKTNKRGGAKNLADFIRTRIKP